MSSPAACHTAGAQHCLEEKAGDQSSPLAITDQPPWHVCQAPSPSLRPLFESLGQPHGATYAQIRRKDTQRLSDRPARSHPAGEPHAGVQGQGLKVRATLPNPGTVALGAASPLLEA